MFIVFLLSIQLVTAAQIHDIDLLNNDRQIITVDERDVVRFVLPARNYDIDKYKEGVFVFKVEDREHKFMVRDVVNERSLVKTTVFIEGAKIPQYTVLTPGNIIKLDFDRDSFNDIVVGLSMIEDNKVTLIFDKIPENAKSGAPKLYGVSENNQEKEKEGFFARLLSVLRGSKEVELIDENEEKEDKNNPKVIDFLSNNWIVTLIVLIVLFVLALNKRAVRRKVRRMF